MSILGRSSLAAAAAALLIVGGCEDDQAKRRAEVAQVITTATADLHRAEAQLRQPGQRASAEQALQRVVATLSSTDGGEDGQRAAAMQLAANGHRQLAVISLTTAKSLEARNRSRRAVVGCMLDAAERLDSLATGLETLDIQAVETRLAGDRQAAAQALTIFSQQVADLDGPIADIERENRADGAEVQRLRNEAAALRRTADDLGRIEGYASFVEGLDLNRQADEIELRIAEREIELRYDLESEHGLAQTSVQHLRDRITTLVGAQETLAGHAEALAGQAHATREMLGETRDVIGTELAGLDQRQADLDELYAAAAEQLARSAARATAAAGLVRGDADAVDAARLEAAQAHQTLGSLHQARARGLQGQAALLRRLDALADVIALDVEVAAAEAVSREASEQAQSAWAEAGAMLGQVSGRTGRNRLEALRQQIAALESGSIAQPPTAAAAPTRGAAPMPSGGGASPAASGAAGQGGAESPQAIVDILTATDPMALLGLFDCMLVDRLPTEQRQFFTALAVGGRSYQRLERAAQAQFGQSFIAQGFPAAAMAQGLGVTSATLGGVDGDTGTITVVDKDGTSNLAVRRLNGRWFFEPPARMLAGAGGSSPQNNPTAQQQMMRAGVAMMQRSAQAMDDIARRTEAGEFASFDELLAAIHAYEQEAQQQMGGMFGAPGH